MTIPTLTDCPECGLPAEVRDRFELSSTEGRVLHVRTVCVLLHVRTAPSDWSVDGRSQRPQ